ncbi:MAG: thioredoxin-dependent thiol peroxidase [Phycisphaeraceae bacterium]
MPQTAPKPAPIDPGQTAPDFALPDQDGKTHRLKDYRNRWVVLYFYPKDDTPGCTTEACQFRDALPTFNSADAVILGVSPDDSAAHTKFRAKHHLPFTLLADTDKQTCQAYGVWGEKSMYGKTYLGVLRTTYLINPKGKVAHRWDKVSVNGHDQAVLQKIAELKQ